MPEKAALSSTRSKEVTLIFKGLGKEALIPAVFRGAALPPVGSQRVMMDGAA